MQSLDRVVKLILVYSKTQKTLNSSINMMICVSIDFRSALGLIYKPKIIVDCWVVIILMMVNLLVVLLLCALGLSYSPLYGCFYNQKIKLTNATYFNYIAGGYNFAVTWSKPQGTITKSSYTLVAYTSLMGNGFISFKGTLNAVTSTGAVFVFEPHTGSTISNAIFSLVLLQTCPGYIDMWHIQHVPTELSLPPASRTSDIQLYRAMSPFLFNYDTYNYITSAHISAFQLNSIGPRMQLSIESMGVYYNASYVNVTLASPKAYGNVYSKITFTFIMFYFVSFTVQTSTYIGREMFNLNASGITPDINNFNIPDVYNKGNLSDQCVISLIGIVADATTSPQEISYQDYSITNITNISTLNSQNTLQARYQIFCIQNCTPGTFARVWYLWYCGKCWDYSAHCELCTYDKVNTFFFCTKCFSYAFMLVEANTCFEICPFGYYNNKGNRQCSTCNSMCYTCVDSRNCTSCKVGWPVQGGCTLVEGCQKAVSPVICTRCSAAGMFELDYRSCKCIDGYFIVAHLCTNVIGCTGTTISGNRTICILCDSVKGYELVNGSCLCKDGFIFDGSKCIEVCGDGRIIIDQCDDSNAESGDGCSSTCSVEKNFGCSGGNLNSPSRCIYLKTDIVLAVSKIKKTDLMNQGNFLISISPVIGTFAKLDLNTCLTFSCNQSIQISSISYSKGKITILVDFLQDLEGNPAKIFLSLDSNYFVQTSVNLSFDMVSTSGAKLILSDDVGILALCKMLLTGISMVASAVFAASTFVHKMIGVELIFPLQIAYLVHLVNSNYSQSFSLLKYIGFSSWNLQSVSKSTANIDSVQQNLVFNSGSQQFTLVIVAGILIAITLVFTLIMAVKKMIGHDQDSPKSISSIQRFLLCLYKILLFPFTVAFLPTFFLMSNTHSLHERYTFPLIVQALFPLFMVAASLVFFYEWRVLLVAYEKHSLFQGLPMCNQKHIPVYLSFMLISTLLLSYSYQHQLSSLAIFAAIIELLLFAWMIVGRPYESTFHNVAVLVNLLPAVLFLTYDVLRDYQPALQAEKNEMYLVFAMIGSASLSSLTSIGRILFELYQWRQFEKRTLKKKEQRRQAKQRKKQQLLDKLKTREQRQQISYDEMNIVILKKFKKEKENDLSNKLSKAAVSSLSISDEDDKRDEVEQKKLKNKLGEISSRYSRRNKLDSLL